VCVCVCVRERERETERERESVALRSADACTHIHTCIRTYIHTYKIDGSQSSIDVALPYSLEVTLSHTPSPS